MSTNPSKKNLAINDFDSNFTQSELKLIKFIMIKTTNAIEDKLVDSGKKNSATIIAISSILCFIVNFLVISMKNHAHLLFNFTQKQQNIIAESLIQHKSR